LDHPITHHYKEGLEWLHIQQHVWKIVNGQKWKLFKDLQVFNESLASFFIIYYPKWNHDLIIGQINLVETQMQIKSDDVQYFVLYKCVFMKQMFPYKCHPNNPL
jgi:hypothetical protein